MMGVRALSHILAVVLVIALKCASPSEASGHETISSYGHLNRASDRRWNDKKISVKAQEKPFSWQDYRLPTFIHPSHYDLFMHPNLTTFTNEGYVGITLQSSRAVDFIVLHALNMSIDK